MNQIEQTRNAADQLRRLLDSDIPKPEERPAIREILINADFRLVFLLYEKRQERALDGPFDPAVSRKLDAIRVLLDD